MADYTRREITTTHVEYVLPNPTNWAEVGKVFAALGHDLDNAGLSRSDDRVFVHGLDDEIVFRYQVGQSTSDGA